MQTVDDFEVGGVHGGRFAGGGNAGESGFEVVLVSSKLCGEAWVCLSKAVRREAGQEGVIVELADAASAEEVNAGGDELMKFGSALARVVAAAARTLVQKQCLEQEKKLPEGVRQKRLQRQAGKRQ